MLSGRRDPASLRGSLIPRKTAPNESELLTKTPSQSRTNVVYKISRDYILREQYRDPWNDVRIGKLLEDLDALAGTIAVKVSNTYYFTFTLSTDALKNGLKICNVVPATEEEARVIASIDAEISYFANACSDTKE